MLYPVPEATQPSIGEVPEGSPQRGSYHRAGDRERILHSYLYDVAACGCGHAQASAMIAREQSERFDR